MASYEEIMQSVANADAAGDEAAAKKLYDFAQSMPDAPRAANPMGDPKALPVNAMRGPNWKPEKEVDRFGDTTKEMMQEPVASMKRIGQGIADPEQSVTGGMLPEGTPEGLKRRLGFMGDVALGGVTAMGAGLAGAAGLAGETFGGSPESERKLAGDIMAASEVLVPEMAGPARLASSASSAARQATKAAPTTPLQAGARAAEDLGITPSLGAGGKTRAMTAAGLEKVPFAGSVVAKDAVRFVDEVEQAFVKVASPLGEGRVASEAGDVLQAGLTKFVDNFRVKSTELYSDVGKHIPKDTQIDAPKTVASIRDMVDSFADKPAISQQLGLDKWAKIADDLEGGLSWEAATALRSSIGESIGKMTGTMANMDQGKLKLAYGNLTADLEAAAKASGPQANAAWRRASRYYKSGAQRIEKSLDSTIKAKSPERAFEAFSAMAQEGRASSDVKRMRAIKKSMTRDDWNDVSASIVDRLGRATPGQQGADGDTFSAIKFLTDWNKMSPEARNILLPEATRIELQKLARVAELAKTASAERNFSNTGTIAAWLATTAAAATAPVATGATLGGALIGAKAMTSPIFLRALNKGARGNTKGLQAMADGKGPFADDAAAILRMTAAESVAGNPANTQRQPIAAGAR